WTQPKRRGLRPTTFVALPIQRFAWCTKGPWGQCAGFKTCQVGYFCVDGRRTPCPGGTFGDSPGETKSSCSGYCPAGHFCPEGSSRPTTCGNATVYCPQGTAAPITVSMGYYSGGEGFERGVPSSIAPMEWQRVCPKGHFCRDGMLFSCPGGTFGETEGLVQEGCSGICPSGWYCPAGSVDPFSLPCDGTDHYCPKGSSRPLPVQRGYYASGLGLVSMGNTRGGYTSQVQCPIGSYCLEGIARPCPPGRFGSSQGSTNSSCSGPCRAGHYCPKGSHRSDQVHFTSYNGGYSKAVSVYGMLNPQVQDGHYTLRGHSGDSDETLNLARSSEALCEPGYWCSGGIRLSCNQGFYGSSFGETQANCTAPCAPGYLCPKGSVSSTQTLCGLLAPSGYYADGGLLFACPPGRYGARPGLATPQCTGKCSRGFFCPTRSVSTLERACGGPNYICPAGSGAPQKVKNGFYTSSFATTPQEEECPPGYFRNFTGRNSRDQTWGNYSAVVTSIPLAPCHLCRNGTFKAQSGDDVALCRQCDETTADDTEGRTSCVCRRVSGGAMDITALFFNTTSGTCQNVTKDFSPSAEASLAASTYTRFRQYECEPGFFCLEGVRFPCPPGRYGMQSQEENPLCFGECRAGWYCPEGSTSATQIPCGAPSLFCPRGSAAPQLAGPGTFTSGDFNPDLGSLSTEHGGAFRASRHVCPKGFFCPGDGQRYKCPAGTYAMEEGLDSEACSGPCAAGYYCPEGSTSSTAHKCGGVGMYCPEGSGAPTAVLEGFYGLHTGPEAGLKAALDTLNMTHSGQVLCEPGHYCNGGMKFQCDEGTFQWEYGILSQDQCLPCKAGYFCPSYPADPSLNADENECGGEDFFCPTRSAGPTPVDAGYFTVGGVSNTTRVAQVICEPGHYCSGGLRYPCPGGRYGATRGLHESTCSGYCPKGMACPEGTTEPKACEEGTYAVGGAIECNVCPGKVVEGAAPRCRDSRRCCGY
ncbi:unnamed protein product, partial [Choristocarpus tenellus]